MNTYRPLIACLLGSALLITAGCGAPQQYATSASAPEDSAKKLGTKWGEDVDSSVITVNASRLSSTAYDTATIYYRGEQVPRNTSTFTKLPLQPLMITVTNESGRPMDFYRNNQGQYILPAKEGQRYQLVIANTDNRRTFEVVTTIDGLDVLNGQAGSHQNSGYLVRPNGQLTIDGFRKNDNQVAAFRFAAPEESYVNQNIQGDERNIGVIGFAIFEVKEELPDCEANPFPADNKYAPAPCQKR